MAGLEVSIVVPTRDRPRSLERCLEAVAGQSGVSSLEIIVVDDGTKDGDAVARAVARHGGARLVRLEGRGPAAARNAGVGVAQHPVVCFTDDDCEPSPDWASRLAGALQAGVHAAGGSTINVRPDSPFALASGAISQALRQSEPGLHPHAAFASTANLAVLLEVARTVVFDESFSFASEDRDWCVRLTAAGYELASVPEAVVVHHRNDGLTDFWRRYVRYGEGSYRFRQIHSDGRPARSGFYAGLVREGFERGVAAGTLVCVSQIATAVGYTKEAVRRQACAGSPDSS